MNGKGTMACELEMRLSWRLVGEKGEFGVATTTPTNPPGRAAHKYWWYQ